MNGPLVVYRKVLGFESHGWDSFLVFLFTCPISSYRNHSRRLRPLHQRAGSVADISIVGRGPAGVQKIHGCPVLQVDSMAVHRWPCCNNERLFTAISTVQQFHRASQFQFTREFTQVHNYGTDTDQSEAYLASQATDYTLKLLIYASLLCSSTRLSGRALLYSRTGAWPPLL